MLIISIIFSNYTVRAVNAGVHTAVLMSESAVIQLPGLCVAL